jgi:hypothetical protein
MEEAFQAAADADVDPTFDDDDARGQSAQTAGACERSDGSLFARTRTREDAQSCSWSFKRRVTGVVVRDAP